MTPSTLIADVYARVPAYRAFLDARGVRPDAPWAEIPLTSKRDYLLVNEVGDLCWDASLADCHVIGASSGFSRSGSVFWPKRPQDEREYVKAIETVLIENHAIDRRRTLAFVCLAFGTWFAGMQIATALRTLAASGRYPLTVALPSLNLKEAVEIYRRFGAAADQVLWFTNPSNVSLIVTLLDRAGIEPPPASISFPVVGEYFSEAFRERVADRFGHDREAPFCLWTGYGSADTGDLGIETRATIALRKHIHRRPALSRALFGTTDTPMLLVPSPHALIESVDGRLVVTKDLAIPLIRYDTGDAGGLLSREQLAAIADLPASLVAAVPDPIVFVHGRAADAIVFYGTNLMMQDVNRHFLSLPESLGYAGLFQVRARDYDGIRGFAFTVYAEGAEDETRRHAFETGLLAFLKGHSLEFAAKYDPLCASVGQPLIRVDLADPTTIPVQTKHRFIVED